jgi:hypothetical protein
LATAPRLAFFGAGQASNGGHKWNLGGGADSERPPTFRNKRERAEDDPRQRAQEPADAASAQPIATMRSIGTRARSATSSGTRTSNFISRSESRSFGSVIIFMYLQRAIRLASTRFAFGAAC